MKTLTVEGVEQLKKRLQDPSGLITLEYWSDPNVRRHAKSIRESLKKTLAMLEVEN